MDEEKKWLIPICCRWKDRLKIIAAEKEIEKSFNRSSRSKQAMSPSITEIVSMHVARVKLILSYIDEV